MRVRDTKRKSQSGHPRADLENGRKSERIKFEQAFLLQNELLATRDYAKAVIEAVPPLLVLDQ